jgi:hypothetical protein
MNVNAFLQKDYENKTAFRPKKTNPTCSELVEPIQTQFLQRPKSLAGKSGHTRRSPMGAIILTFISDMHILKRFFGMEK